MSTSAAGSVYSLSFEVVQQKLREPEAESVSPAKMHTLKANLFKTMH